MIRATGGTQPGHSGTAFEGLRRREAIAAFLGIGLLPLIGGGPALSTQSDVPLIVLDPGHGGHDPGAIGLTGLFAVDRIPLASATRAVADCDLRRPEFRSAKAARNRCARLTATPASSARWSGTIDNELVREDFAKAAEWIKRGGVELT